MAAYNSGKREKISEGLLRRAITLCNLKRYDDALFSLEKSIEYAPEESATHGVWKAKIGANLGKGKKKIQSFLRFTNFTLRYL